MVLLRPDSPVPLRFGLRRDQHSGARAARVGRKVKVGEFRPTVRSGPFVGPKRVELDRTVPRLDEVGRKMKTSKTERSLLGFLGLYLSAWWPFVLLECHLMSLCHLLVNVSKWHAMMRSNIEQTVSTLKPPMRNSYSLKPKTNYSCSYKAVGRVKTHVNMRKVLNS